MRHKITHDDVKALWEKYALSYVTTYNISGHLHPEIYGFRLRDHVLPVVRVPPTVIDVLFGEGSDGDIRRGFVRKMVSAEACAAVGQPDAVMDVAMIVSEAWWIERDIRKLKGLVSDEPDRKEALTLIFHWAEGMASGICKIDPATRKASMGELMFSTADNMTAMGGT